MRVTCTRHGTPPCVYYMHVCTNTCNDSPVWLL